MGKSIILKVSLVFINLLLNKALAQSNQFYYHKTPGPVDEGAPVRISQLIFTTQQIQSGILFFRDITNEKFKVPKILNNYSIVKRISLNRLDLILLEK